MTDAFAPIASLLGQVRARWRTLLLLKAATQALLVCALLLGLVAIVAYAGPRSSLLIGLVGVLAAVGALGAIAWVVRPLRARPSDLQLARFIEERVGGLDERLVSAVDVATVRQPAERPAFAVSMVRDAARATEAVMPSQIIGDEILRRGWFQAAGAATALLLIAIVGRQAIRQSFDAVALAAFPLRQTVAVTPGNARVQVGTPVTIEAHLVGNAAPADAQLLRAGDDGEWSGVPMEATADGGFRIALNDLTTSFRYRVAIGTASSEAFDVAVVRPPRVTKIDVHYEYPKSFGLPPRTEENGGDIYAPAGTDVRLLVHTDVPATSGRLALGDDTFIDLKPAADGRSLDAALKVAADNSYRVGLADADGFASRGDTEYFIRAMEDRAPEIHVVKPASDRRVTSLEEVDIEAEATDDFGIASLELVYTVHGQETVVPLRIPGQQTTVSAGQTLFLEDLDVRPGDLVSYFVRARDVPRGKRASEARSDIFFLEIKNFEEEFTLAASQAAGGGASNPQLDELVSAQKEVIVATWKIERRAQAARGARSEQDVKSIATAESELKTRVERTASSLRTGMMRDPRARQAPGRGGQPGGVPVPRAGQVTSEEDALTAAAAAMGRAVPLLNGQKTADAIAPEMEALTHLLKAQSDVKKREVQRQQAGRGGGSNRATQDLSSLFDKELARNQETNYEAPSSAAKAASDPQAGAIDKIKELARRQDELLRRQQELDRQRAQMTPEALRRELERLTRAQSELRQQADDIAEQMSRQGNQQNQDARNGEQSQPGQQQAASQQQAGGRGQSQSGQSRGQSQSGQQQSQLSNGQGQQQGQSSSGRGGQQQTSAGQSEGERRMRQAAEAMRASASGMRSQNSGEAQARSAQALEQLRELERQLQGNSADGRRRALGDLQLEARQIAEAQRQVAAESERASGSGGSADARRRLAGEQERLADRVRGLQQGLRQQSQSTPGAGGADEADSRRLQQAAGEAGRELERQRLAERMEQSANGLRGEGQRQTSSPSAAGDGQAAGASAAPSAAASRGQQEDMARSLSQLADRLAAATQEGDAEARRLAGQMSRAQDLRQRLDEVTRRLGELEGAGQGARGQSEGRQGAAGQPSAAGQPNPSTADGRNESGRGQTEGGTGRGEIEALRQEMNREIAELRALLDDVNGDRRDARGGGGRTFEGRGMTLSDPGTQAFKQDFAAWKELERQATIALDNLQTEVAARLKEKTSKDRLTAGTGDRAPDRYQRQVESYFKSLATGSAP